MCVKQVLDPSEPQTRSRDFCFPLPHGDVPQDGTNQTQAHRQSGKLTPRRQRMLTTFRSTCSPTMLNSGDRRAHFLLGSDSCWTLKKKSPTPSQGLHQMLLEKGVKQAREGMGHSPPPPRQINSSIHSFTHSHSLLSSLNERHGSWVPLDPYPSCRAVRW